MKIKMHSKIGKYARPLNICFNGENKTISTYNDTVEFEFEEAGEYNLSVEQIKDENPGIISQIILTIIMCFKVILSLYNLESFNFSDYNDTKPYSINKYYSIKLNSNTDICFAYTDTSFSSATNKFSIPYIEIENFSFQDEITDLNCSVESLKQNKRHLKITLSLIFLICFLVVTPACYFALLSKSIASIAFCSLILFFLIVIYIISLLKIILIYNEIIKTLTITKGKEQIKSTKKSNFS